MAIETVDYMCFNLVKYSGMTGNTWGVSKHVSFRNLDVIYKFLHLNFNTLINCIATCSETPQALPVTFTVLDEVKTHVISSMAKRSRCLTRNQRVAGSIPGGDIYFHFEFFACFHSLQVSGTLTNEIKHDHSPVVIVVLDPRYD